MQVYLWYSLWAFEIMILPPLCVVFPLAVFSLIWAWRRQQPKRKQLWTPAHWLVLTHLLFFGAAILIGTLCPSDASVHPTGHRAYPVLNVLLYASLGSCAFWVWRMKDFRWFAASLMAVMECPVVGAIFIASMSVTGDWL